MSGPLINRSLTTIRTELEFLHDSEVITEQLYNALIESLPPKYQKDMKAWDLDKLKTEVDDNKKTEAPTSTDSITDGLASTSINPPVKPERLHTTKALGYCKAIYDYQAQEGEDLALKKDDVIAVVEHLSEDWWKGYKKGTSANAAGVFPSNYVNVISQQEFDFASSPAHRAVPPPFKNEKASYDANSQSAAPPPPQYDQTQVAPLTQQPSYGGYSQYPPQSTNYYPPQQYSPQPQAYQPQGQPVQVATPEQAGQHSHMRKFGGKLGNAAIFGAGATIGSDIVNSIF
ncbi:unnamed protein product [Debaryomyces tyrocola]|nr:unnamed protein product [Debaryomyces tyrocola]